MERFGVPADDLHDEIRLSGSVALSSDITSQWCSLLLVPLLLRPHRSRAGLWHLIWEAVMKYTAAAQFAD